MALNNDSPFHLTALLCRGKSIIKARANSSKTHPKYGRTYKSGFCGYALHAEMAILNYSKPGDYVIVMRWTSKGEMTMAMPCEACQRFLRQAKIRKVYYSDWDGQFQMMRLS